MGSSLFMKKTILIVLLLATILLTYCSIREEPIIYAYVCGNEGNVAKYWRISSDGTEKGYKLAGGTFSAMAKSIIVHNGDIYICGYESNGAHKVAKWWKNGVEQTPLTDSTKNAEALSIFVHNEDVYICGYEMKGAGGNDPKIAKWWKNGVVQPVLTGGNSTNEYANSILVYEGNVYICGYEGSDAKWWKIPIGGTLEVLALNFSSPAYPKSMFVYKGDIYISGASEGQFSWWRNGIRQMQNNAGFALSSIFVWNDIVYTCGSNTSYPKSIKWLKNSELQIELTEEHPSEAFSIYVYNKNVYICGYERKNGKDVARLWKIEQDNTITKCDLTDNSSKAYSVYVTH